MRPLLPGESGTVNTACHPAVGAETEQCARSRHPHNAGRRRTGHREVVRCADHRDSGEFDRTGARCAAPTAMYQ